MEEIKYEATFSSSVPCRWLFVIREDYAWVGGVETKKNGAGKIRISVSVKKCER